MMETYHVKFSSLDDVRDFNEIASRSDAAIDVSYRRTVVDAGSILGLMSLGVGNVLTVRCSRRDENFERAIHRFLTEEMRTA